ncbi:ABC transporter ATP-binding protein [Paracoccus sp. S1E-3]|uniref:ABC transporter ATP-binding protein n=1 Tax=Paracoccus sp. S1E-3 TaxID=2756130 RepID=UPI0015EE9C32|nr:ATP-binding cassette domain-containing protein [Paracoccus sp. S1E-3]MBA4491486.1 ATP-binding cassette domain-containing protein [Paracoccus sp. S1E-3]
MQAQSQVAFDPSQGTAETVLSVDNLHKSFGALEVLKGISLEAHKGDVISILGSSGSGKSTFLRCLNLLETPSTGDIRLKGEPVFSSKDPKFSTKRDRGLTARQRSRMPMVFQGFNLWSHMTILQNVMAAPSKVLNRPAHEVEELAMSVLERVGIANKRDMYPSQLSGGQQQRAAIARALAMKPTLILFDEPTSALDPELVGEVLRVMRKLAEEHVTMLVVTHEMNFARDVSTKVVFLHQGLVEEEGTPDEVFGSPKSQRCREFLSTTSY